MRVGIYARVSTDTQQARATIGSQLQTLRDRIAAEGDDLVAESVIDLVQIQGVIAEHERAKFAERGRRGKLYRARAGEVLATKIPGRWRRVRP